MKRWRENREQKKWQEVEEQEQRRLVMPCNDGGDARRCVGRKRQKPDERMGKRKRSHMIVPLFPEIEAAQSVATKLRDISATVGTADLVLSLSVSVCQIFIDKFTIFLPFLFVTSQMIRYY